MPPSEGSIQSPSIFELEWAFPTPDTALDCSLASARLDQRADIFSKMSSHVAMAPAHHLEWTGVQ